MLSVSYIGIISYYFGVSQLTLAETNDCVTPPLECPNKNITFWLYTRSNKDDPHQLLVENRDSIMSAPWVEDAPVKVLIHGYTGHRDYSPNTEIRPAYLKCCDYNVISIDYNPIVKEPCYIEAAENTELVGMCTAQLIDELINEYGFSLSRFHVVGFSLGGQTAGFISNYLKSGQLERITGLDPALPLFVTFDEKRKLDLNDAKYVDILHTNAPGRGKIEASGTIDFYANGGFHQPGCDTTVNQSMSSCDHARAPAYFGESIMTNVGFYSTKCTSWLDYILGQCDQIKSETEVLFGEYVDKRLSGLYFFTTNSESPYARGLNERKLNLTELFG